MIIGTLSARQCRWIAAIANALIVVYFIALTAYTAREFGLLVLAVQMITRLFG